jgi:hypothetical protein
MKKYISIFLMIIVAGFAGCKQDFLDKPNYGELSPEVFPQEISQVELFVNSMYANQHAFGLYGHDIFAKAFYPLEHTSDQDWINDAWWNDIHQNNLMPGNEGEFANVWRDGAHGVTYANLLLEILPEYRAKYAKTGEEDQLKIIEGQAYYMRAWHRMILLGFFGESFISNGQGGDKMGIPLIDKVAKTREEMYVKRATVKESWDAIVADLKHAETLMAGKTSWDAANITKVTIWGVKAMLGKALIYSENFADAKTKLKEVIDGSGKTLVSFDIYKDMFLGKYKNNAESLIEISYKQDGGWSTWGQSTANNAPMVFEPAVYSPEGQRTFASWTNIFVHDKNLKRFGFNEPTAAPAPNPAYDASKPCNLTNLKEKPGDAFIAKSKAAKTDGSVDPRMWVAGFQPFVDEYNAFGQMSAIAPVIQYDNEIGLFHSFSFRKYTNLNGRGPDSGMNYTSQMYLMRLADVYLLYAEACAKTGDNASALEYLNKVHRRAYNLPINTVSSVDYASLTAATKATDHPVLKNDPLKYERWAEMLGEGGWWFDVCRWKMGTVEAAYYIKVRSGTIKWSDARSYAQPIPIKEFETNPNMVQNPGY